MSFDLISFDLISCNNLFFFLRAFARYDIDGDGLITAEDLKNAFQSQGRESSTADLMAWVRKRDSSGRGAVCLKDFSDHYQ